VVPRTKSGLFAKNRTRSVWAGACGSFAQARDDSGRRKRRPKAVFEQGGVVRRFFVVVGARNALRYAGHLAVDLTPDQPKPSALIQVDQVLFTVDGTVVKHSLKLGD
jgi:hypothetical protein